MFEDLLAMKGTGTVYDSLTPLSDQQRSRNFDAGFDPPDDYVRFLSTIGWGSLGASSFMLYGGLVDPIEIYGDRPDLPRDMRLFGDDFAGNNVGFCPGLRSVFEITPGSMEVAEVAACFSDFIRERIARISKY